MSKSHWRAEARQAIETALAAIPKDASFSDKKAGIDAAYPFGPRQYHPYKIWLSERKAWLARLSDAPAGPLLSPLDRAKAAYMAAEGKRP